MKVLILNHEFPPIGGGAANATAHIARELVRLGVRVTVITAAGKGLQKLEARDGFHVIRMPPWRRNALESRPHEILGYLISAFPKALSHCFLSRTGVIHAFFGVPSGALAYALNRLIGIPYLISFRGRDVHGGKGLDSDGVTGLLRAVSRTVWRRADALIANSRGLKEIALRVEPSVKIGVIPNGIDTRRFTPTESRQDRSAPLRLLFVGRLESYKGLADLFLALKLLRRRTGRTFTLRIVGDGSLRDALPDIARRAGIAGRVCFSGVVPASDMPEVYRKADLFVLPSTVEGMPNVVLEAMASGLPVLATRIPGSEDLVQPGKTGLLVAPSDPDALAGALGELMAHDVLRIRMGQRARQEAETRSWKRVAEAYLEVYERIAGEQGNPIQHRRHPPVGSRSTNLQTCRC